MSWADDIRRSREAKAQRDPELCLACDGTGLDDASGDGWWNQDKCAVCGGDGYCSEREPEPTPQMTADEHRAEEMAQFDKWNRAEAI